MTSRAGQHRIAILGAGCAGYGAAHRLHARGVDSALFEKRAWIGGRAAVYAVGDGFRFDDGPHISFTRNARLQDIFAAAVDGRYEIVQNRVNNYWHGHWIKHPAQVNLHGLPVDLVVRCLEDFVAAQTREPGSLATYRDWLHAAFGATFSETFPAVYGRKYHTTPPDNMTSEWVAPRFYRPALAEVLRGALTDVMPDVHYVSHFRYPSEGGFAAYLTPLPGLTDLHLEHEVVAVDPYLRRLHFAHGPSTDYTHLISSLPLPELIMRLVGVPEDVRAATTRLACTNCVLVNVGVDRADLSSHHWTYFYDPDVPFARLSFPHMLSSTMVPPGCGSIQCECYFSAKYFPFNGLPADLIDPVLMSLRTTGYLKPTDNILHVSAWSVPYANVIFDLERPLALATVHRHLDALGIRYAGRYGLWGYQWTDEAFVSGEGAAQSILDEL